MKKGEIWLVEFPSANGHEQTGKRPVIIIAETEMNISIVIPFTSNLQALRFPYTVEVKPSKENKLTAVSVALVFQVRAIDKKRLKHKVGDLGNSNINRIDSILKKLLGL